MKPKVGERFISILDGVLYTVKKVVHEMVVLESRDGERQILTSVESLRSFYAKKEDTET